MPPKRTSARPVVPRRGRPRATAPPRRGRPRAATPAHSIAEEVVTPAPAPAPAEEVEQTIGARDVATILQECLRAMQDTRTAGGETRDTQVMRAFQRMRPPTFAGQPDPLVAEEWLEHITRILDSQAIVEPHLRIRCATFQFTELASQWWRIATHRIDSFGEGWDAFVAMFNDHYFPETARIGYMDEFMALLQRDMTVTQYESRFTALGRFAPHVIREERLRVLYFVRGLKTSIRDRLAGHIMETYDEAVIRATKVERELADLRGIRESRTQSGAVAAQASTSVPVYTGRGPAKRYRTSASSAQTSQQPAQFLAPQPPMPISFQGEYLRGPLLVISVDSLAIEWPIAPREIPARGAELDRARGHFHHRYRVRGGELHSVATPVTRRAMLGPTVLRGRLHRARRGHITISILRCLCHSHN